MIRHVITSLLMTCFFYLFTFSQTIFVPDDYPTIQGAVNASAHGDSVIIRPGTYYENIDLLDKEIFLGSMMATTGDPVYRDQTIIDGGLNGPVIYIHGGQDTSLVIMGCTITNGIREDGGGVFVYGASPLLKDLLVTANHTYNQPYSDGGGVRFAFSNGVIKDCIIRDNVAYDFGAGICIRNHCNVLIEGCEVFNNILNGNVHAKGAGIYTDIFAHAEIKNTLVFSNHAAYWGGGIGFGRDATGTLINVTITDNTDGLGAGGLYTCYENVEVFLGNCIIWGNSGSQVVFGDAGWDCELEIAYSDIEGGEDDIVLYEMNTLIWLDGNMESNPLFMDPYENDYSLSGPSPCIDAGTDLFIHEGDTLINIPESGFLGTAPDMGAVESAASCNIFVPDHYTEIQQAIQAAADSCRIIVRPGIYYENIDLQDKNIKLVSMYDLTGDESLISSTIIDGMAAGPVINIMGGQDTTCMVKGFTIRNGFSMDGGGINCVRASAILTDLIIMGNSTYYENYSDGGGVKFAESHGVLRNSVIRDNYAYDMGGGVAVRLNCSVEIDNCWIFDNELIYGVHGKGGGIWIDIGSDAEIKNTMVFGNSATFWGGGIGIGMSGSASIVNVTVTDNMAGWGGGGLYTCYDEVDCFMGNTISYGNIPDEIVFGDAGYSGTLKVCHSDIEDETAAITIYSGNYLEWLEGNIGADPMFLDPWEKDYSLMPGSPCIDAGTAFYVIEGDTLIDLRASAYHGTAPDMGALEYDLYTGLNELEATGPFHLLANPVRDKVSIVADQEIPSGVIIKVTNIMGATFKEVLLGSEILPGEMVSIDLENLPAGIYVVSLQTPSFHFARKVIMCPF